MRDKETGLTTKQLKFAQLVAQGKKDVVAYQESGYSIKCTNHSCRVNAYKLLHNPKILLVIEQLKAKVKQSIELTNTLTTQKVLETLAYGVKICKERGNMTALARYVEMQGRYMGMFKDNVNVTDVVAQKQLESAEAAEVVEIGKVRVNQFVNVPTREAQKCG